MGTPAGPAQHAAEVLEARLPGTLLAAGQGLAWKDLLVQVFARRDRQEGILVPAVPEPLVVWVLSGAATVEEREPGGAWQAHRVAAGDFFLSGTPEPYELRWQAEDGEAFVVMHLYLGLAVLQRAMREAFGARPVALREVSGQRDDMLSALLAPLRLELAAHARPSALFVQGLAQSLAAHLVRAYGMPVARSRARPRGGLPAFKLRRVLAAMEARLGEDFQLAPLAREAGLSAFHFSRAFKQSMGDAPSRFMVRLRMERARRLLRETARPVVDIALELGYASPSHFAQVFRRETGLAPAAYRRHR